jgi:hypothetical protein
MGEIREKFMGDKGASKRPELQYIPGDAQFIPWNTFLDSRQVQAEQMENQQSQQALNPPMNDMGGGGMPGKPGGGMPPKPGMPPQ